MIKNADHAVELARQIGYPVMLKPTSAGGGKGMRLAFDDRQCREGFARSTSEAKTHFGDDRVFVEKYIEQPRHIEVQVLADKFGQTIHLGERECSLQRRHQKVIEEAPSPFLTASARSEIARQAVALAKAVNYTSAGTVEFVVDRNQNSYFLEMNTRLQVEHPVTEFVTGVDLVEQMIRVAANEKLTLRQSDIDTSGWAFEARIYAEDAARNFLPSTGRLIYFRPPDESQSVRVDTGVYEGSEISIFYDPMIAKLITYADDRTSALAALRDALDRFWVSGVTTNIPFLQVLARHDAVAQGQMDTSMIEREFPDGYDRTAHDNPGFEVAAAIAAVANYENLQRSGAIGGQLNSRNWTAKTEWLAVTADRKTALHISKMDSGHRIEFADGDVYEIMHAWKPGQRLFAFILDDQKHWVQVKKLGCAFQIDYFGCRSKFRILTPTAAQYDQFMVAKTPKAESDYLASPMPGLLVQLNVEAGQEVKAGDAIAIVEAMKMENVLRAERDGRVDSILVTRGESLAADQPILKYHSSNS